MTISLKTQLIELEGKRAHAYRDSEGFWTIGVGRCIDASVAGSGLSVPEMYFLLDNDIRIRTQEVDFELIWSIVLDPPRHAVLVNMAFQMGTQGLLGFKRMLAAARDGRYAMAAEEMRQSDWAKQTPERCRRLAHQMETGEWS